MSIMAALRKVVEIAIGEADAARLQSIARSRTEPASRVERARILLRYREDASVYAGGRSVVVGAGLPKSQGCRISARTLDDAVAGPPRPRAWSGSGSCLPDADRAGHG